MNDKTQENMINNFMNFIGAGKMLDNYLYKFNSKIFDIEQNVYPTVRKLEIYQKRWRKMLETLSEEQKKALLKQDFAILEPKQMKIMRKNVRHGKI